MWSFTKKGEHIPKPPLLATGASTAIDDGFLSIASIDFFGPCVVSKNRLYVLGWSDADRKSGSGGFRTHGEGSYILLEKNTIIVQGHLERPNDGNIANNGTFILNDWMFGDGLKGTFFAFNRTGAQIIKHFFHANLYNNGVSDDGKYAVCQMAHNGTSDGGMLAFFDLESRSLLWQQPPVTGWAQSYAFDVENQVLFLVYENLSRFRYAFSGKFLDAEQWVQARIKDGSGFELSRIGRQKLNVCGDHPTANAGQEIRELFERALERLENYPNEQAIVHRAIGELYERLHDKYRAIEHYNLAMKFNPKVGVKRRLSALKGQTT
jgi:hypothetical protein